MKKNGLLSGDILAFLPSELGTSPAALPTESVHDTTFRVDGESYPLADAAAASVEIGVVNAGKPVASIATLADYLVNGFWSYANDTPHHWASHTISYNINGLNSAEQFLAQTALQAWSEVANLTFVQTSGAANIAFTHNGTMQAYSGGSWSGGVVSSAYVNISSDWITNDGGAYDGKTGIDSYGYQTYIHEIGHALGLGHQGPYNGSASYSTNAVYANDTWQYSIMSYFGEQNYSGSSYRYVVTPQMADIYAVASMYGAATSTRTSDTVYGFNSNAGAVFNFSNYTSAPALTIYDSGGNDTLDCSGYSAAQIIDLHAGAFSSVGGLVNNIGIALNATIEKAVGGSGNDRLTASDTGSALSGGGGNDTLIGGAGNDRLVGGAGVDNLTGGSSADTFVFLLGESSATSGQHDRITDFVSGADHIDLSGYDAISSTGSYDQFKFLGTAAFSGAAGELNYFYNGSTGVTTLQGDTNGDGVADFAIDLTGNVALSLANLIGAYATPIVVESFGSTKLVQIANEYDLQNSSTGIGPDLKFSGAPVTVGMWTGWAPVGAEQTSSGYDVAFRNASTGLFNIWSTDTNGNYITNLASGISGTSAALENFETIFHQDLNGDGTIGLPPPPPSTVVEAFGVTSLVQSGSDYFLNPAGGGTGPELYFNGAPVTVGMWTGWAPVGAEQTSSGYDVAFRNASTGLFNIWSTDTNGNYITNLASGISGTSTTLENFETVFHQDLNGDGVLGVNAPTLPAVAHVWSAQNDTFTFIADLGAGSGNSSAPETFEFNGAAAAAAGHELASLFNSAVAETQYLQHLVAGDHDAVAYFANLEGASPADIQVTQTQHGFIIH